MTGKGSVDKKCQHYVNVVNAIFPLTISFQ